MNREIASLAGVAAIVAALTGCSAGHNAVMNGDAPLLQQILSKPNHGNENVNSLLDDSGVSGCTECVKELVAAGAKPDAEMLVDAAIMNHEQAALLLADYGADVPSAKVRLENGHMNTQIAHDILEDVALHRSVNSAVSMPPVIEAEVSQPRLAPKFHAAERPNDYALIIGVEKYDSLPAATYAEGDAATAADFVRAMGVPARNVVTLTSSHATRSSMVKQIENWLAKNTDETSTVYFYFSGHGAPDPATGQAYLVPFDGDPQYLAETAYPLKRLYEKLGALKTKRTIVMIDSCFSGAGGRSVLAKGARPLVNNVDTGVSSADGRIAVLTASGANQISGTNDEKGHGLFTYYLFNGLNGAAKDGSGRVTIQSLYSYLKPKVMDDARRANGDQTPQLQAGTAVGDVVLREK